MKVNTLTSKFKTKLVSRLLIPAAILFMFISCCKEDDLNIDRDVENFSSEYLKTFDIDFSMTDVGMDNQGRYVLSGNGRHVTNRIEEPAIARYDPLADTAGLRLLHLDTKYEGHRHIELLTNPSGQIFISTYSYTHGIDDKMLLWMRMSSDLKVEQTESLSIPGFDLRPSSMINGFFSESAIVSRISTFPVSSKDRYHLSFWDDELGLVREMNIDEPNLADIRQVIYFDDERTYLVLTEHSFIGSLDREFGLRKMDINGNTVWTIRVTQKAELWTNHSKIARASERSFILMFPVESDTSRVRGIGLVKFDDNGDEIWSRNLPAQESDLPVELITTMDGNYVLLSNTTSFGNDQFNVMLTKLDTSGNIIWDKVYGGNGSDHGTRIIEKSNGNLMIFGNTNEGGERKSDFSAFVLETDPDGIPIE